MQLFCRVLLYGALVTPLFVFNAFFFPFIDSKMFSLGAFSILAAMAWMYLWSNRPETYAPKLTWLLYALGAYIGANIIAAIAGVNMWRSFWSTFERMDGTITWIELTLFFLVMGVFHRTKDQWRVPLRISLAVSTIIGLRALRWFGIMEGTFTIPTGISAVFGSPIYLGVYALFHAGIALYLLYSLGYRLTGFSDLRMYTKSRWALFYAAAFLLNVLVLFLTYARGPMLGFFVGSFVFVAWYFFFGKQRLLLAKTLGVGVLVLALLFPFWKDSYIAQRLYSISDGFRADETRTINWSVAWNAFQARPLFGWGGNNYMVAQNESYNPRLLSLIKEGFDRPHNKYLEILVDSGAVGMLTYIAFFGVAFLALFRMRGEEPFATGLFAGLFTAYLIQNITAFDNPGTYLPLFLLLAFVNTEFVPARKERLAPRSGIIIAAQLLLFVILWQGIWQPVRANFALAYALKEDTRPQKNYDAILRGYTQALSYQTFGDHEIRVRLALSVLNGQEITRELLTLAIQEMEKEAAISDKDAVIHISLAKLYDRGALLDKDKSQEYIKRAEETFKKAIELGPRRPDTYQHFAVFLLNQQRGKDAREILAKVEGLNKELYESERVQWYIGTSYMVENKFAEAYDIFQAVLKKNPEYHGIPENLMLARATYELQKYDEMVHWYEELYRADSDNPQYAIYLAVAYKQVGNKGAAIDFAKYAVRLDPSYGPQADEFIKSLE